MPLQIAAGETFANGQQVDASRLNNLAGHAVLLPGSITEQPDIGVTVDPTDKLLIYDNSTSSLRSVSVSGIVSNIPASTITTITSSVINGQANGDVAITPNDGLVITGKTFSSSDGINVVVTSATHGLSTGQLVYVSASNSAYSGLFQITVLTSDTFKYVFSTAITAAFGTCSYQTKALFRLTGNASISGNLIVNGSITSTGSIVLNGNVTNTGTVTNTGDVNFTGTLKVNGSVGYVLTDIVEYTIPHWVAINPGLNSNIWTSVSLTKPSEEIWIADVFYTERGKKGYGYSVGVRYGSQTTNSGTYLYTQDFYDSQGGNWVTMTSHQFNFVIPAGTALTSETISIDGFIGSGSYSEFFLTQGSGGFTSTSLAPSKMRISKYKTA